MKWLMIVFFSFGCHCCEILIYLQDVGETLGLLPVAAALAKQGTDVAVVLGGVAETYNDGSCRSIREFGLEIDPRGERSRVYGEKLALTLLDAFNPKVFISGVAFEWQGELFDACQKRAITSVAFWDNFSDRGEDSYFTVARNVQKRADHLFVPSDKVAAGFSGRDRLFVSGHPSLEVWAEEASKVDVEAVKKKLGTHESIGFFIGGYGAAYESAFELFINHLGQTENLFVFVGHHPKFGGKIEAEILSRYPNCPVQILKNEVSTLEAVVAADVVFCHQSTAGVKAEYLKKNVIWFPLCLSEYKSALEKKGSQVNLGIPEKSCERILHQIAQFNRQKE